MNIRIEIESKQSTATFEEIQRVKRCANVLIAAGHHVKILWCQEDDDIKLEESK